MNKKTTLQVLSFQNYLIYFLMAFLPAVLLLGWLLILKLTGSAISVSPVVSDELLWYHQITGVMDHLMPLGYYGYNGGHAVYGTYGPWGAAILLPYALWGKLFGWGIYSMCIANVSFLGLALFLFALSCRLSRSEAIYVCIAYCSLLMNLFYSISSMAEPLRWGMAILLTGTMIRIYRGYAGKFYKYVFTPLLLLFCTEAFMLLAIFIPVYLMLVLPIRQMLVRLLVSGGITGVLAVILRKQLFLIVPAYGAASSDTSAAAGGSALLSAIFGKLQAAWQTLSRLFPTSIWGIRNESHGYFSLFLCFFLIITICAVIGIFLYRKKESMSGYLFAAYLMVGILGGYCLVYNNPQLRTLCRGINTALVCAVLILALYRSKKFMALLLLITALTLPSCFQMTQDNLEKRYLSPEDLTVYQTALTDFDEVFDISKNNSRWDNTIALYGNRNPGVQTAYCLALPRSAGYNCMLDGTIITEAKYAVVYRSEKKPEQHDRILANLLEYDYSVIYQQEAITILSR